MTTAAPPALPAVADRAARLPPPGAPSSSRPSSSPLLPPPLLLLQRSGRSRFLPPGPPRFLGPARAVPLPELGSSQAAAAAFFLGMVAAGGDTGQRAQWTGYKLRGGRGGDAPPASTSSPARPKAAAAAGGRRGRAREEIAPLPARPAPPGNPARESLGERPTPARPQVRSAHKASQLQPGPGEVQGKEKEPGFHYGGLRDTLEMLLVEGGEAPPHRPTCCFCPRAPSPSHSEECGAPPIRPPRHPKSGPVWASRPQVSIR
jgi:hypothetical protein